MRLARPAFTLCATIGLIFAGGAVANADWYPPDATGSMTCPDGKVVRISVNYWTAGGGSLHYNVNRTNIDSVGLPPLAGGEDMSSLSVNTWSQSSSWYVRVEDGGQAKTTANCVSRY